MSEYNHTENANGQNLPVTVVPSETPLFAPQTINAAMGEFASKLAEIVSIPNQQWPENRSVQVKMDVQLVPVITVTIENRRAEGSD